MHHLYINLLSCGAIVSGATEGSSSDWIRYLTGVYYDDYIKEFASVIIGVSVESKLLIEGYEGLSH